MTIKKWWASPKLLFVLLGISLASILFRNFKAPACTEKVMGPLGTSIIINCDSAQFMQDSQNPERILNGETSYQDRPLYALTSHFLARIIGIFVTGTESYKNSRGELIEFEYAHYFAFLTINLFVLVLSLIFLIRFTSSALGNQPLVLLSLFSLVFLNDPIKAFTWTPHTQVFSVLLTTFGLFSWTFFEMERKRHHVFMWFATVTTLVFFYPSLMLLILIPLTKHFIRYIPFSILPISCFLLYPQLIIQFGGNYRNAAIEDFNQFVWIMKIQGVQDIFAKFWVFASETNKFLVVLALLSVLLVVLTGGVRKNASNFSIWIFCIGYGAFLFGMGFYSERLSTPFLVLTIVLGCLELWRRLEERLMTLISLLLVLSLFYQYFFISGNLS